MQLTPKLILIFDTLAITLTPLQSSCISYLYLWVLNGLHLDVPLHTNLGHLHKHVEFLQCLMWGNDGELPVLELDSHWH